MLKRQVSPAPCLQKNLIWGNHQGKEEHDQERQGQGRPRTSWLDSVKVCNERKQVVHTRLPLSPSSTLWYQSTVIIIMSHLLHENKSQVLVIQMVDMQMEQAKSYELIQGLVPRAG